MAVKGDRARLEPVARQMYVDGQSLEAVSVKLGVSRVTLSEWKGRSRKPSEDFDEWDKARERKISFAIRMENLLDREILYAEERQGGGVDSATWDSISKLGALVVKFKAVESQGAGYDKAKVFLENMQWIVSWLRENDPEGLQALAADFDAMAMAFKTEQLNGNA
ncbi:MAG: hypothetical protein CVU53_01890 [Deltaproteobacteria bacterium HGW-Deltaproteobacteria-11]|jgi:transposase|nr:MAG: hypothetical protein CVU53_01890 [Deltaproteobacteria bacterium HGW-Deltaproteobacteria-11]